MGVRRDRPFAAELRDEYALIVRRVAEWRAL